MSDNGNELANLRYNRTDFITSTLKGVFGIIPFAGPTAQELLGAIIPKQRMDRVVVFVEKLATEFERFQDQYKELVDRMYEPRYSSLFYKACVYSADSISVERIEYIKNLFLFGLSQEDIEADKAEALMNLLSRINDTEVIYLEYYHLYKWNVQKAKEFQNRLKLEPLKPNIYGGMSQDSRDSQISKQIFIDNLMSLGLFEAEINKQGKKNIKCSSVGDLLIRRIKESV